MNRSCLAARRLLVPLLLLGTALPADVVLHPGTLTGTVGLSGWTQTGGSVYVSNGTFYGQSSVAADGSFKLTIEGNQTYTSESTTLYYGSVYLSLYQAQSVTVPVGGSTSVDLRQAGATVTAGFTVAGGTVAGWSPSISGAQGSGSFSTYSSSSNATLSVPVAAGMAYNVSGSVQIQVSGTAGAVACTISLPLPARTRPALAEGATDILTDSFTVGPASCTSGIAGTVAVNHLPAGRQVASGFLYEYGLGSGQTANWSNQSSYDYAFTLAPGSYWLGGTINFGGLFSSWLYLPTTPADVAASSVTRKDFIFDAVGANGKISVVSPVGAPSSLFAGFAGMYDPSAPTGGPTAGYTGYAAADGTGQYSAILVPGKWQPFFTGGFNTLGGSGTAYFNIQDSSVASLTAAAGSPLAVPDYKAQLSTGSIVFDVIEPAGSPEVGISYPVVGAWLSSQTAYYSLYAYTSVANAASPSVQLVGPPGHYQFNAYAQVQGTNVQFASSTIDLGQAVDTPAGTNVITIPKDSSGNPTPITLDFSSVSVGGTTTVSVTDVGPAAPPDYNLLAAVAGKQYLNINTSAQFAGNVGIALKYDPIALGLTPWQEQRLALQQYLCAAGSACQWVVLSGVFNPSTPAYAVSAAQASASSSPPNPDTTNHIVYGITTSLGTFALTYPKVVLVPPTDTCIGAAGAPAQLTTDPALCSATVDNVNQRAGGCSGGGGGLASCLFDSLAAETLALGPHAVSIAGTAVDGSSSSCTSYVAVVDREPPAISCAAPVKMECTAPLTPYTVQATCSDNCGSCSDSCGSGPYALGTTAVSCNANDAAGNKNSCQTAVTVVDTTPPLLSMDVSPKTLWPPNHTLIPIAVKTTTSDLCDPAPVVACTASSSEPAADNKSPDIVWTNGQLSLRAERLGTGPGRTYTVTCTSTDQSGNKTVASAQVLVPHDQRK